MKGILSPLPSPLIKQIMGNGTRRRFSHGLVFFQQNTHTRCAVIVSKRVDKRATKRNFMKRLVRESIRKLGPQGDFVFVIQKILPDSQFDVQALLQQSV